MTNRRPLHKLTNNASMTGAIMLLLWWIAMPVFLPLEAGEDMSVMILHPAWMPVNLVGLIAVLLLAIGFPGYYLRNNALLSKPGILALVLSVLGLILYACIQYYETFLWPAAGQLYPELVVAKGVLVFGDPLIFAGLLISGIILSAGFILFGIKTLKATNYKRLPLWFLIIGVPLFALGMAIPVRTMGIILFAAGTIMLSVYHLRQREE